MKNKFLIVLCMFMCSFLLFSCNDEGVKEGIQKIPDVVEVSGENEEKSENTEDVSSEEEKTEKEPEKEETHEKDTNIRNGFLYKVGNNYGFLNKYGEVVTEAVFSDVQRSFSDNGLLYVCANGRYGFLNENAEMVIERNFMGTRGFGENGTALVRTGFTEYGYINEKGEMEMVIEPTPYEGSIVKLYNFDKYGFARVYIDEKCGLIDVNGNWIVYPGDYTVIGDFADNGLASVTDRVKSGFINTNGEVVIPIQYYALNDFKNVYGDLYIASVRDTYGYGSYTYYINDKGETVTDRIAIAAYSSSETRDNLKVAREYQSYSGDILCALIDFTDGNVLFDLEYKDISFYEDGMIFLKKDGLCGLADSNGDIVIDFEYTAINEKDALGYYWAKKQNGTWICLDQSGNQVFSKSFEVASGFAENGLACVGVEINYRVKYGYIDKSGEFVIEPIFDGYSSRFSEYGYAVVSLEVDYKDKYGVIDKNGDWVIEPTYDYISTDYYTDIFVIKVDGNLGIINKDGVQIIMPQYDDIYFELDNNIIVCEYDDIYDVYYKDGRLIGNGYSNVNEVSDEYLEVHRNNKEGIIDINGNVIIEPLYDYVWLMDDND